MLIESICCNFHTFRYELVFRTNATADIVIKESKLQSIL
jgi:hypothetical protein